MKKYKQQEALVLFSGGQDSTTSLYWAIEHFSKVSAVCFSYGQRHIGEVDNAGQLAEKAGVPFQVIKADIIGGLSPNSLTNNSIEIVNENRSDPYPNSFVPGRNLLFLTLAASIAYEKKISNLVIGVSEVDYSGYPDCRDSFIRSANKTINLALGMELVIHTPLMQLSKTDIWELADKLGVFAIVRNETVTCYNNIVAEGCGYCPACILRNRGLNEYLSKREERV